MDAPMSKKYDVMISYRGADKDFAQKLATAVEATTWQGRQLRVWFDEWEIHPGESIVSKIDEALAESRFVALVMSPDYMVGEWPTAERDAALYRDPAGRLGFVLPILHRPCNIPPLLAYRKYIDFTGAFKPALGRFLAILKNEPLPRGKGNVTIDARTHGEFVTRHLDAFRPDETPELLYTNLFAVTKLPTKTYSAPTQFRWPREVNKYYGYEKTVPPFLLLSGRLYTFANLRRDDHPFVGVIEDYDIRSEPTQDWMDDPTRARHLIWLLNDAFRAHAHTFNLSYDKTGKRHYYRQGVLEKTKYKLTNRGDGRELIIDYTDKAGYKAHRAIKLRFELIGGRIFLKPESGWVFTTDGRTPIEGRRRSILNARFRSLEGNAMNLSEIRFWLWLIGEDKNRLLFNLGGEDLEVDARPAPIPVNVGIYGDQPALSEVLEPPMIEFSKDDVSEDDVDVEEEPADES